jgi:hypothetical protein
MGYHSREMRVGSFCRRALFRLRLIPANRIPRAKNRLWNNRVVRAWNSTKTVQLVASPAHRWARVGVLALFTAVCQAATPNLSVLFPDVPAFAPLTEVRVGMSIRSLLFARKPAPALYLGYREVVGRDTVEYRIDHPLRGQTADEASIFGREMIHENEPLIAVNTWERTPDVDSADTKWTNRVIALARRAPAALACFTIPRAGSTRTAIVKQGGVWLGVQLVNQRVMHDVRGNWVSPPVVITFAASRLDPYVPDRFVRTPIECPSSRAATTRR